LGLIPLHRRQRQWPRQFASGLEIADGPKRTMAKPPRRSRNRDGASLLVGRLQRAGSALSGPRINRRPLALAEVAQRVAAKAPPIKARRVLLVLVGLICPWHAPLRSS